MEQYLHLSGKYRVVLSNTMSHRETPRLGGEDYVAIPPATLKKETPPRVRGKTSEGSEEGLVVGNTPARARETTQCRARRSQWWNHPRVHGEDIRQRVVVSLPMETPPHLRGRLPTRSSWPPKAEKHPRLSGEDLK